MAVQSWELRGDRHPLEQEKCKVLGTHVREKDERQREGDRAECDADGEGHEVEGEQPNFGVIGTPEDVGDNMDHERRAGRQRGSL